MKTGKTATLIYYYHLIDCNWYENSKIERPPAKAEFLIVTLILNNYANKKNLREQSPYSQIQPWRGGKHIME
jgi:hypothetical protein